MDGADGRDVPVPVLSQPQVAEPLEQDTLHPALILNAPDRMIEKILIEADPRVPVPPGGMEHDLDRQRTVG